MINITEGLTEKVPGVTSFKVSFQYNPNYVEKIKQCDGAQYNKETRTWEIPVSNLARVIDLFCEDEDLNISLLQEEEQKPIDYSYELLPYKTKPYAYQEEGIRYGLVHDNFLLLDAPGLGKTLQIIYLAEELRRRDNIEHCLIICGINTLKTNWKKEIQKHSNLSCRILGERTNSRTGKTRIGGVKERLEDLKAPIEEFFVITNVETLRNDEVIKELTKGKNNKFDMIAADEVHKMANPSAAQSHNFLKLASAKHKIAMSGTLLLNSPNDSYVSLKWLGLEKATFTNFKYFYSNYTGQFHNILLGYKNMKVLKHQIEKFSLRRTKDLLDLPPKTVIHEFVEMNDQQQTFYDNIKDGVVDQVDKVEMSTANLLAMVTRLRQATACPSLLTTENIVSSKVERACELAEEIVGSGNKVVIFSTFKETLTPVMKALEKYKPLLCTGDVKDEIVSANIDKFQNSDENKVICCTTAKMGTGITLTAASYAIFIDCTWTQANNTQCEDRIYRIGSKSPVFIYYLWCSDTFDERVKELVDTKGAVSDYVIDNKLSSATIGKLKSFIADLQSDSVGS